jgi:AraC-like DNA-binding protein
MSESEIYRLGGYREYAPPADLRRIIEVLWTYSWMGTTGPQPVHRVLPEPGVSLLFVSVCDPADGRLLDSRLMFMGPVQSVRVFRPEPGLHFDAIRLKPEWTRELMGVDPEEYADEFVGFEASRVPDGRAMTLGSHERLHLLLGEIRTRHDALRLSRDSTLAHDGLEQLRSQPEARVEAVARDLRISERHLRRVIRQTTGAGPKYAQRVGRLLRAVAAADRLGEPSWARLATESGFYDQAHLIQEFRALTGRLPVELHAERGAQQIAG